MGKEFKVGGLNWNVGWVWNGVVIIIEYYNNFAWEKTARCRLMWFIINKIVFIVIIMYYNYTTRTSKISYVENVALRISEKYIQKMC